MLRIWKGKEVEGFEKGKDTLFICSDKPLDYELIKNIILQQQSDRIYLGAGRLRFPRFDTVQNEINFINFCKKNNIQLLIETEPVYINDLINYLDYATILLSIRLPYFNFSLIKDINLKLDDFKNVRIFNNKLFVDTNLQKLQNSGLFEDIDKIIFEEE